MSTDRVQPSVGTALEANAHLSKHPSDKFMTPIQRLDTGATDMISLTVGNSWMWVHRAVGRTIALRHLVPDFSSALARRVTAYNHIIIFSHNSIYP